MSEEINISPLDPSWLVLKRVIRAQVASAKDDIARIGTPPDRTEQLRGAIDFAETLIRKVEPDPPTEGVSYGTPPVDLHHS